MFGFRSRSRSRKSQSRGLSTGKGGIGIGDHGMGVVPAKNRFKLSASASAKNFIEAWHKDERTFLRPGPPFFLGGGACAAMRLLVHSHDARHCFVERNM